MGLHIPPQHPPPHIHPPVARALLQRPGNGQRHCLADHAPLEPGCVQSPPVDFPGVTFLIKEQLPHPSCLELDRAAWDVSDLPEDGGFKRRLFVSNRCF